MAVLCGTAAAAAITLTVQPATATNAPEGDSMADAFTDAAEEYDVPRDLLVAVGYGETHLDGHNGEPSQDNGFGVMHLVSNPDRDSLGRASKITGESETDLKRETRANILGGAAVLRAHADALGLDAAERDELGKWYPAVARYGGAENKQLAKFYADSAYEILADGVRGGTDGGDRVRTRARDVAPDRGGYADVPDLGTRSPDYPPALWVPAHEANYAAGRSAAISQVVVHVTQGSYAGSISWFQNPEAEVSAHYVIRSADGEITQMVRDGDTAWHARDANSSALGIEHEGFIDDPSWFTDAMYRSSAALTKHLCDTHGIPKDREHIVGHSEVPGNDHTDPGPNWNWDTYMGYVNG
ncbi:N-acetylmuramoyl-L-alanine amidase [Streptomyces armeniacus]|uniref:N-acetylmuramoyl-L-alanine amidase n=1 Tax=Streptomyces armeniacus TaxID=83291 RepID=A0A345XYI1_9ACTN|nr:N-acetylmuramoyl-L-alanine amidase [Streptomyces armeniacus]